MAVHHASGEAGGMDADERGRSVVWSSGSPELPPATMRRRQVRGRVAATVTLCGAVAALVSALVVLAPSGAGAPKPEQPLWQPTHPVAAVTREPVGRLPVRVPSA